MRRRRIFRFGLLMAVACLPMVPANAMSLVGDSTRPSLYHVTPRSASLVTSRPHLPLGLRPRQQLWLNATLGQRVRIAEQLGEEGAREFARAKGWRPIFDGRGRTIPQGLDQVYQGRLRRVHVVEAKGGMGQLGRAYGHPQGSAEWAVKAADRTIRSSKVSLAERKGAQAVLKAASRGYLRVHVVRTSHVLGEPRAVVLEQTVRTSTAGTSAIRVAGKALIVVDVAAVGYSMYVDVGRYRSGEIGGGFLAFKAGLRTGQLGLTMYAVLTPDPTPVTRAVALATAGTLVVIDIASDPIYNAFYRRRAEAARQILQKAEFNERAHVARAQVTVCLD